MKKLSSVLDGEPFIFLILTNLKRTKKLLDIEKKAVAHTDYKLKYARKVAELRVTEAIKNDPDMMADNPHLIVLLSAFQDKDDFEMDKNTGEVKPSEDEAFLKNIEDDLSDEQHKLKLGEVRNKILDKLKTPLQINLNNG